MKHLKNMQPSKKRLFCIALAAGASVCCIVGAILRKRRTAKYF